MLTAFVAIGIISGYGFIAGITYSLAYDRAVRRMARTPDVDAVVPSFLWPVGLPAFMGVTLVERIKARRVPMAIVNKESRHV